MQIYKNMSVPVLGDNLTFVVTDDCNLRCRYCYEKNKQPHTMQPQTGIDAVNYFFDVFPKRYDTVVFDFIGGEPFVCIDLVELMVRQCLKKQQETHKWENIVFNFSTNGTCFKDKRVRDFIDTYRTYISVGISLDGCKAIHDYNRNDSWDEVMKWFPYWRQRFPANSTKSTLNHEAIPYVFESIKFLLGTCLQEAYMNTIYEDVWEPGDDKIYYDQLIQAADWMLANKIYKTKCISLFDINLLRDVALSSNNNWCGCGSSMLSVDYNGDLFPCTRFKTLSKQAPLVIGNVYKDGGRLDYKKLLPFYFCHNTRNTPDCAACDARVGCPNCTAFCYDETGSIFDRVSYMCDMHRARKRANDYYWSRMAKQEGVTLQELFMNKTVR